MTAAITWGDLLGGVAGGLIVLAGLVAGVLVAAVAGKRALRRRRTLERTSLAHAEDLYRPAS
jgi:hypothetical protein